MRNKENQAVTVANSDTTAQNPSKPPEEIQKTPDKSIVVYFSATGNTGRFAGKIAEETGADIFEIVPEEPYTSEDLNYSNSNCRANKESNDDNARPAISNKLEIMIRFLSVILSGGVLCRKSLILFWIPMICPVKQ